MNKSVYLSLLFDFYGELLTEKQRQYFDQYYNDDLSLAEIAENEGISRQGVRDMLLRAENTLLETERKTGLAARHGDLLRQIGEAEQLLGELSALSAEGPRRDELAELLRRLQAKLQEMKL